MIQKFEFIVLDNDSRKRLDTFVLEQNLSISRTQIKRLIEAELILVNGASSKAGFRIKKNDRINVSIPDPKPAHPLPENIPLNIIYEDKFLIVINKPAGMVVHPACGNYSGTLVNALLYHGSDLSGIGGVIRPGIVHRIDKNTSGVLVSAKNDFAHQSLSNNFQNIPFKENIWL